MDRTPSPINPLGHANAEFADPFSKTIIADHAYRDYLAQMRGTSKPLPNSSASRSISLGTFLPTKRIHRKAENGRIIAIPITEASSQRHTRSSTSTTDTSLMSKSKMLRPSLEHPPSLRAERRNGVNVPSNLDIRENLMSTPRKRVKVGPKVRYDTISQDRSDGCERKILFHAFLVKSNPLEDAKTLRRSTLCEPAIGSRGPAATSSHKSHLSTPGTDKHGMTWSFPRGRRVLPFSTGQVEELVSSTPSSSDSRANSDDSRGPWTSEMDDILVENHPRLQWEEIAEKFFGNAKSGNACRKRYARVLAERREESRSRSSMDHLNSLLHVLGSSSTDEPLKGSLPPLALREWRQPYDIRHRESTPFESADVPDPKTDSPTNVNLPKESPAVTKWRRVGEAAGVIKPKEQTTFENAPNREETYRVSGDEILRIKQQVERQHPHLRVTRPNAASQPNMPPAMDTHKYRGRRLHRLWSPVSIDGFRDGGTLSDDSAETVVDQRQHKRAASRTKRRVRLERRPNHVDTDFWM